MIRFIIAFVLGLFAAILLYTLNVNWLGSSRLSPQYDLNSIYIFLFVFFILTIGTLEVIFRRASAQVGFGFLVTFFVKLAAFAILFYPVLFRRDVLTFPGKLSILLPLMLFILLESIYCAYLLRQIDE